MNTSRRNFLRLVGLGVPVGAALAACGGCRARPAPAGGAGGGKGVASYWTLSGKPQEDIRKDTIARFNKANPKSSIDVTIFANDAYKQKVKTALGAGKGPTMIWGWGGGGLKSYVDADQVIDLDQLLRRQPRARRTRRFPSAFGAATIDGTTYAVPVEVVTPIVFYYNKRVFDQVGAERPAGVGRRPRPGPQVQRQAGIAPFSLAGQPKWTSMMWLEFFFDRIGGPEVFQAIFDGETNAWSNPAAIQALDRDPEADRGRRLRRGASTRSPPTPTPTRPCCTPTRPR